MKNAQQIRGAFDTLTKLLERQASRYPSAALPVTMVVGALGWVLDASDPPHIAEAAKAIDGMLQRAGFVVEQEEKLKQMGEIDDGNKPSPD